MCSMHKRDRVHFLQFGAFAVNNEDMCRNVSHGPIRELSVYMCR